MIKYILIIFLVVSISTASVAQKVIVLSQRNHRANGVDILIFKGDRVKCKFTTGEKVIGEVLHISGDSILIDGKAYFIDNIKAISKRQKGITALVIGTQILSPVAGTAAVIVGNFPVGIGFLGVQIVSSVLLNKLLYNYPTKNVKRRWKLTVIDYKV